MAPTQKPEEPKLQANQRDKDTSSLDAEPTEVTGPSTRLRTGLL